MNRRLTTILLALVLGLVGTLVVVLYVKGADRRAVEGKKAVDALVAARAIPAGTQVSALSKGDYVKSVPFPASALPPDYIKSVTDLPADGVVKETLPANALVRDSSIGPKGSTTAFSIPPGKLAVTVQLNDPQRVGGYLHVGSKVVIFLSGAVLDSKGNKKGEATFTRTLLTDVEVLSLSTAGATGSSGAAATTNPAQLVTFAVTQHEAEKLIWGTGDGAPGTTGGLYLGLEGDDGANLTATSPGVSSASIFG